MSIMRSLYAAELIQPLLAK